MQCLGSFQIQHGKLQARVNLSLVGRLFLFVLSQSFTTEAPETERVPTSVRPAFQNHYKGDLQNRLNSTNAISCLHRAKHTTRKVCAPTPIISVTLKKKRRGTRTSLDHKAVAGSLRKTRTNEKNKTILPIALLDTSAHRYLQAALQIDNFNTLTNKKNKQENQLEMTKVSPVPCNSCTTHHQVINQSAQTRPIIQKKERLKSFPATDL